MNRADTEAREDASLAELRRRVEHEGARRPTLRATRRPLARVRRRFVGGDPEQVLVEALAEAGAQCRADGREHAVRVAWEALGALLASREQPTSGATEAGSSTTLVPLRREK